MRLRPTVLALMARGGLVGLVSLSTGCPDTTTRPAPTPAQPAIPKPSQPSVAPDQPSVAPDQPSPIATTAPSSPGQTPVEPDLSDPDAAPQPVPSSPQAAVTGTPVVTPSVATPACGGQHTDMNHCPDCGYCPPCGRG